MLRCRLTLALCFMRWLQCTYAQIDPTLVEQKDFTISLFRRPDYSTYGEVSKTKDPKFLHWTLDVGSQTHQGKTVDSFDASNGVNIRKGAKDSVQSNPFNPVTKEPDFQFQYKHNVQPAKAQDLQARIKIGSGSTSTNQVMDILKDIPMPDASCGQSCVDWKQTAIQKLQDKGFVRKFDVQKFTKSALDYGLESYKNTLQNPKISLEQMKQEFTAIAEYTEAGGFKKLESPVAVRQGSTIKKNMPSTTEQDASGNSKGPAKKPNPAKNQPKSLRDPKHKDTSTSLIKTSKPPGKFRFKLTHSLRVGAKAGKMAVFTLLVPYAHNVLDALIKWDHPIGKAVKGFDDAMAKLQEMIGGENVPEIYGNELKLRFICWARGEQEHRINVDDACDRLWKKDAIEDAKRKEPERQVERAKGVNQLIESCEEVAINPPADDDLRTDIETRCNELLTKISTDGLSLGFFDKFVLRVKTNYRKSSDKPKTLTIYAPSGTGHRHHRIYKNDLQRDLEVEGTAQSLFNTPSAPITSLKSLKFTGMTHRPRFSQSGHRISMFSIESIMLEARDNATGLWMHTDELLDDKLLVPMPKFYRRDGTGSNSADMTISLEKWQPKSS